MAENLALERHRNNRRVQRTLVQVCTACLILRLGFSVNFMQNVCQECALVLWLCTREAIGPLHDPVTWYGINYAGTQKKNAVGLPKQRNSYQSSPAFLCFECPTALLRSSIIYSVSCDRILQRAY